MPAGRNAIPALLFAACIAACAAASADVSGKATAAKQTTGDAMARIVSAIYAQDAAALSRALAGRVNLEAFDQYGLTALMHAASSGFTDGVSLLLDAGAAIDTATAEVGHTALALAAANDRVETGRLLIRRGADLFHRNVYGGTPYYEAINADHPEFRRMCRELIDPAIFSAYLTVFPLAGLEGIDYYVANYMDHNPALSFPARITAAQYRTLAALAAGDQRAALDRVYTADVARGDYRRAEAAATMDHEYVRNLFETAGSPCDLWLPSANLDYNGGIRSYDGHIGADYFVWHYEDAEAGVPVFAAADGVVFRVDTGHTNDEYQPNTVWIDHGYGRYTYYAHLREPVTVTVGRRVAAGEQIGWLGSTGGNEPHLHFSVMEWHEWADPYAGPGNPGAPRWRIQPGYANDRPADIARFGLRETSVQPALFVFPARLRCLHVGQPTEAFWLMFGENRAGTRFSARLLTDSGAVYWNYDETMEATERGTVLWFTVPYLNPSPGRWTMELSLNGTPVLRAPFLVLSASERSRTVPNPANTPPATPRVAQLSRLASNPRVLRVELALPVDAPDLEFDHVLYRYVWTVDARVVRDVTIDAHGDYLLLESESRAYRVAVTVNATDGTATSAGVRAAFAAE